MLIKIKGLVENINHLVQNSSQVADTVAGIGSLLCHSTMANVVLLDRNGRVICYDRIPNEKLILHTNEYDDGAFVDSQLIDQLNHIADAKHNIGLNNFFIKNVAKAELKKYLAILTPIYANQERIGTLVLYRQGQEFMQDDLCEAEIGMLVIMLLMRNERNAEDAELNRSANIVKSAVGTLSYSELEAVLHIFHELEGIEGLLVASKIADRVGITRSVIVNALRKLESAGIIESRSLGMKGTYIKILNPLLIDELQKMKN